MEHEVVVARAYGQAVLDAVWAHETDDSLANLATRRMQAVGVVRLSTHEGQEVETDLTDALAGTLILVRTLVEMLRDASGRPDHEIIQQARQRFHTRCGA